MRKFFERKLKTLNRIEIIATNIKDNAHTFQKLLPEKHIFPVLKSNAYGHGIAQIAQILRPLQFPFFVVDSYYEALQIWKVTPRQKVLIIGWNHLENLKHFNFKKISLCVYDLQTLHTLGQLRKTIQIHFMVNTGMNREGFPPEKLSEYLEILKKYPKLHLEGVFSHLADAENTDEAFTNSQVKQFSYCLDSITQQGFSPEYIHLGNTAGSLKKTDRRINSVRLGAGLYGGHDFKKDSPFVHKLQDLRPALRLISTITNIIPLKRGEKVSYNGTFTAPKDMTIGIVPVGYHEALPRIALSNTGFFEAQGKYLPIVGRVCMNLTCFDLKGLNLKIGDEVEIISAHKNTPNSIEHIALANNTIQREIWSNINKSMRRIIV